MSELPQGWVEATLEDIAIVNPGRIDGLSADARVSFVPMPAVSDVDGEIVSPTVRPFAEVSKGYTQFQEGDVIFAKITPCMENGKIAVARSLDNGVACGSTEFHVVRPLSENSPDYIWRFLRQKSYRDDAEASMTGAVGQRRVPAAHLKESCVPLPPLPEQRRIVAKIDSLTGKSRRARDHLDHIPRLVEKYKQAVLAAAFRGELTREWRANNKTDKRKREADNSIRNGASATRARVRKTAALTPDQIAGMWDGPTGWQWSQVGDCAFVTKLAGFEYTKYVKYNASGDFRVIKAENAGPHGFRETDYSRVSSDAVATLSRSRLVGGELLVVFVGAGTGNVAVVPEADDFFLGPNIGMVRPTPDSALSRYLELFFRSAKGRELLLATSKAVAQPSLSMGAIRSTPVLLPPLAEQAEVVRIIEIAFSWIARLASEATSARKLIDRLDQAVLAKAFRGELVPQDPADEPASVLLERIRAERGAAPKAKRGWKAKVVGAGGAA